MLRVEITGTKSEIFMYSFTNVYNCKTMHNEYINNAEYLLSLFINIWQYFHIKSRTHRMIVFLSYPLPFNTNKANISIQITHTKKKKNLINTQFRLLNSNVTETFNVSCHVQLKLIAIWKAYPSLGIQIPRPKGKSTLYKWEM